jgi:hypothetical protein
MTQIVIIGLDRLNNGAHYAYHSDMLAIIEASDKVKNKVARELGEYRKAFEAEDEALTISRKSFLTDDIVQADDERDALYVGLKAGVRTFAKNIDAEKRRICKVITQLFKDYNIDTHDQLHKETGLLTNLVDDLQGKFKAEVAALSLTDLVADLRDANERVRLTMLARSKANGGKVKGALRTARLATDRAFAAFARLVNAYILVEGDKEYLSCVTDANSLTEDYRRKAIGAKAGKSGETENKPGETEKPEKPGTGQEPGGEEQLPDPVAPGGKGEDGSGKDGGGDDGELPDPLA